MGEYLSAEQKDYDGEFYENDQELEGPQQPYQDYAKQNELEQDVQAARSYKNKNYKQMLHNAKKNRYRKPLAEPQIPENERLPFTKHLGLKPIKDPKKFADDFFNDLIDENMDYHTIRRVVQSLRS